MEGRGLVAVLSLVDLAGSETAKKTGVTSGARALEGAKINQSLFALSRVIEALSRGDGSKPPFRDSKLTHLLKPALEPGAPSKTALICAVHPAAAHASETLSTLQFARKARCVVTRPVVREELTERDKSRLLAEEYEALQMAMAQRDAASAAKQCAEAAASAAELAAVKQAADEAAARAAAAENAVSEAAAATQAVEARLVAAEEARASEAAHAEQLIVQLASAHAALALANKEKAEQAAAGAAEAASARLAANQATAAALSAHAEAAAANKRAEAASAEVAKLRDKADADAERAAQADAREKRATAEVAVLLERYRAAEAASAAARAEAEAATEAASAAQLQAGTHAAESAAAEAELRAKSAYSEVRKLRSELNTARDEAEDATDRASAAERDATRSRAAAAAALQREANAAAEAKAADKAAARALADAVEAKAAAKAASTIAAAQAAELAELRSRVESLVAENALLKRKPAASPAASPAHDNFYDFGADDGTFDQENDGGAQLRRCSAKGFAPDQTGPTKHGGLTAAPPNTRHALCTVPVYAELLSDDSSYGVAEGGDAEKAAREAAERRAADAEARAELAERKLRKRKPELEAAVKRRADYAERDADSSHAAAAAAMHMMSVETMAEAAAEVHASEMAALRPLITGSEARARESAAVTAPAIARLGLHTAASPSDKDKEDLFAAVNADELQSSDFAICGFEDEVAEQGVAENLDSENVNLVATELANSPPVPKAHRSFRAELHAALRHELRKLGAVHLAAATLAKRKRCLEVPMAAPTQPKSKCVHSSSLVGRKFSRLWMMEDETRSWFDGHVTAVDKTGVHVVYAADAVTDVISTDVVDNREVFKWLAQ